MLAICSIISEAWDYVDETFFQLDDNIKVMLQRLGVIKLAKTNKDESDDSDDESKGRFSIIVGVYHWFASMDIQWLHHLKTYQLQTTFASQHPFIILNNW